MPQEQLQNTVGKITVSWDDLQTRKVEQRLKEQDALARNRTYAAMDESMVATDDPSSGGGAAATGGGGGGLAGLWRNSIFALALFGLIGGLLAWGCGAMLDFKAGLEADAHQRMQDLHNLD